MVAAHVERHRDDLLVEFHADLFLGFGHAGDTSLLALEGSRDDFDDAADFDAAGDGLGLQVRENVLKRGFPGKDVLGVLERRLVDAAASRRVSTTGAADELLHVVKRTGLDEHVAAHGRWVEDGHDFTLKGDHGTAAVEASVHFVSDTLFGVDGGLDDVEERADAAVHFSEEAVGVFHVEVGEDAVVILDGTGVNPLGSGVNARGCHLVALSNDENGHDVDQVATHIDTALGAGGVVVEVVNGNAGGLSHTLEHFFGGVSDAPHAVPEVGEVFGAAVALEQQQFLFKANKGHKCFRHIQSRSDSVADAKDIVNQPRQEVVHEHQNGEPDGSQHEETDATDNSRLTELLLRRLARHADDTGP